MQDIETPDCSTYSIGNSAGGDSFDYKSAYFSKIVPKDNYKFQGWDAHVVLSNELKKEKFENLQYHIPTNQKYKTKYQDNISLADDKEHFSMCTKFNKSCPAGA